MLTSTNPDTTTERLLKALAEPLRRRIVELLATEALCTCHLVAETGAGQTTISHHLRVLRESRLVDTEACGRFTYYRLRPEALQVIADEVTELARQAQHGYLRRRPC